VNRRQRWTLALACWTAAALGIVTLVRPSPFDPVPNWRPELILYLDWWLRFGPAHQPLNGGLSVIALTAVGLIAVLGRRT